MKVDAVIIEVEFRLESAYSDYGHFVCLRFIDQSPQHEKLEAVIRDLTQFEDVKLIDYNYSIEKITEKTNLDGFEFTKH